MKTRYLIASAIVVLAASSPVVQGQEVSGFRCSVVSTSSDLEQVPEYQRIGARQATATTVDVLFLYSRNNSGASRRLAERHVRGTNDIFVGRRPPDGYSQRLTPPPAANTGVTVRVAGYQRVPQRLDTYIQQIEETPDGSLRDSLMNTMLTRLRDDSSVDNERRHWKADIVVLWIDAGRSRFANGIAFQVSRGFSRSQGFVIMAGATGGTSWWDGPVLLAHEIGHTLGLAHHASEWDRREPYVPHGQGYLSSNGSGTIMTVSRRRLSVFSFDGEYVDEGTSRKPTVLAGDRNHRAVEAVSVGAQFVAAYEEADAPPPDPEPDPDPDPVPVPDPTPEGEYTNCVPSTSPLVFDGGYRVSMCYATLEGGGDAKAGIWASGQSGLLWFFDRGNAEVLVKVLDGCGHNGYRWAFVAPVTTLAFNLRITDPKGRVWTHRNPQGMTASTKSDTRAFPCR